MPDDIGFVAVGYLDLVNAAFAEAGYLTIPSAPVVSGLAARNRDVVVTWKAPTQSPGTVVGYDVLTPDGALVCQTDQLSCTVSGLPDGTYAYTVRSRNAENQGDALPAGAGAARGLAARPAGSDRPGDVEAPLHDHGDHDRRADVGGRDVVRRPRPERHRGVHARPAVADDHHA